jgi:hypothetical protein
MWWQATSSWAVLRQGFLFPMLSCKQLPLSVCDFICTRLLFSAISVLRTGHNVCSPELCGRLEPEIIRITFNLNILRPLQATLGTGC